MNSPESSMICDAMRRMNALSSTMRTRGLRAGVLEDTRPFAQRAHLDAAVADVKEHAATVVAARILGHDWDVRIGKRVANGGDVSLADIDAARRQEIAEHARAADDLRANAL